MGKRGLASEVSYSKILNHFWRQLLPKLRAKALVLEFCWKGHENDD